MLGIDVDDRRRERRLLAQAKSLFANVSVTLKTSLLRFPVLSVCDRKSYMSSCHGASRHAGLILIRRFPLSLLFHNHHSLAVSIRGFHLQTLLTLLCLPYTFPARNPCLYSCHAWHNNNSVGVLGNSRVNNQCRADLEYDTLQNIDAPQYWRRAWFLYFFVLHNVTIIIVIIIIIIIYGTMFT